MSVDASDIKLFLDAYLLPLQNQLNSVCSGAVEEAAKTVKYVGEGLAPVDTGALKEAFTIGPLIHGARKYTQEVVNDVTGERGRHYSAAQEFGWHDASGNFHQGRFFMMEAAERAQEQIQKEIQQEIEKRI